MTVDHADVARSRADGLADLVAELRKEIELVTRLAGRAQARETVLLARIAKANYLLDDNNLPTV
jgi:hypothetical protein